MSFNLGSGLKRIINVFFWIWVVLGTIFIVFNFDEMKINSFILTGIFAWFVPYVIRKVLFYIIDGFAS
jgi:hypothetical protein|tara:strand:- start:155 stop:358 length:204 start_codon:yes stop_codon:yes gene_type:complete